VPLDDRCSCESDVYALRRLAEQWARMPPLRVAALVLWRSAKQRSTGYESILCSLPLYLTADVRPLLQVRITMRPMLGIVPIIGAVQVLLEHSSCTSAWSVL